MKKVMVFGATGGTGKEVVRQLLLGNYAVTAIVRRPEAFELKHPKVKVFKRDVLQPGGFGDLFSGQDAVISCLSARNSGPTSLYSRGMQHIMQGMEDGGVRRVICLSAMAVIVPPKGSWIMKFACKNLLQRVLRHTYADMLAMERMVAASDLDWTIIRPPWLRNGKHTGKYRTAIGEYIDRPYKISRADLADFIVNHLEDRSTYRALAEVSY